MKRSMSVIMALLLCACKPTFTPQQIAFLHELADRPVVCHGSDDCAAKWGRATQWVNRHSFTGLKTVSDDLIATNIVSDHNRPPLKYPEFTVVRYAQGKNTYVMDFSTYCDQGFTCNPTGLQQRADFVTFVMGPPPGVIVHADGNGATKTISKKL